MHVEHGVDAVLRQALNDRVGDVKVRGVELVLGGLCTGPHVPQAHEVDAPLLQVRDVLRVGQEVLPVPREAFVDCAAK